MKLLTLYHQVLSQVEAFYNFTQPEPKAGRRPKISDQQITTLFILSYLTQSPVLTLTELLTDLSINSYHILRKARQKRTYSLLRQFILWKVQIILVLNLLSGKADSRCHNTASSKHKQSKNTKDKKIFWTKRKRNLYSVHYGKRVQFEELYYGVLVMVLCDEDGVVYDIWFTYGSMHETRAYRIRNAKSAWFRRLVESAEVYGDRGYEGVDGVHVCTSKEGKLMRQVVEGVLGCVKSFNAISRWRKGITLLAYLYGYTIPYSFFRGWLKCYG
ncbi:MAG: hypothetical protein NZ526_01155 [Aquificaceae bacterium]|nr:hypothetical protein [Aquificaceae bacterium]